MGISLETSLSTIRLMFDGVNPFMHESFLIHGDLIKYCNWSISCVNQFANLIFKVYQLRSFCYRCTKFTCFILYWKISFYFVLVFNTFFLVFFMCVFDWLNLIRQLSGTFLFWFVCEWNNFDFKYCDLHQARIVHWKHREICRWTG